MNTHFDVIIIGAGASGLTCAAEALQRGRSVALIEHREKQGKKILISGGGKANFTNLHPEPKNYICTNPHFVTSALKRYSPYDILDILERHHIQWHEREHGQLFCNESARDLVTALTHEAQQATTLLNCSLDAVSKNKSLFELTTSKGPYTCSSLVVATGGLSIPKMGATGFGHILAKQFGHTITPLRAGLVPLRYAPNDAQHLSTLSGISFEVSASCNNQSFTEQLLFTHRGLSGPVILQISNYWEPGQEVILNLLPTTTDLEQRLTHARERNPKQQLKTALCAFFPERLALILAKHYLFGNNPMGSFSNKSILSIVKKIHAFPFKPGGSEGYRTAEATIGGVNTNEISSKTMESTLVPHLFFIGEVLDVTGHLGGYNFHWAWASGSAAGKIA